jgi:hypothetical protein
MRRCLYNAKSYRVGMKELRVHTYAALFRETKGSGEYTTPFFWCYPCQVFAVNSYKAYMLSQLVVTTVQLSPRFALFQLTSFRYYVDTISMPRLHTASH